jgi:outer membrane receptor protein involved in Fe transport
VKTRTAAYAAFGKEAGASGNGEGVTMLKSIKRKQLLAVGASLAALQACPAMAQTQPTDTAAVEEVVVTAQRRVEANIDVPIAITAVGADEIQNITAGYMTDIGFKAPNVFMSQGSISPSISIRGVSSQSNINAGFPPAVAIYVDEVYQGRDPTFNTILNDVERVEVLRGPQGTLYGKNTIGGAINITTAEPTNEFTAFGDLNFGNYDLFQARATVGGAIVPDKLMVRASLVHRERGGWLRNSLTNEKLNDISANGARLVIASKLSDKLRFRLSADTFRRPAPAPWKQDLSCLPRSRRWPAFPRRIRTTTSCSSTRPNSPTATSMGWRDASIMSWATPPSPRSPPIGSTSPTSATTPTDFRSTRSTSDARRTARTSARSFA